MCDGRCAVCGRHLMDWEDVHERRGELVLCSAECALVEAIRSARQAMICKAMADELRHPSAPFFGEGI